MVGHEKPDRMLTRAFGENIPIFLGYWVSKAKSPQKVILKRSHATVRVGSAAMSAPFALFR